MKIDWKKVAASSGYKSLKAAYIKDVQAATRFAIRYGRKPMREKAELMSHFKWVIGRAIHYAHGHNRSIEAVLWTWESDRKCWWLNYYQDSRQPKRYTYSRYRKKKSVS